MALLQTEYLDSISKEYDIELNKIIRFLEKALQEKGDYGSIRAEFGNGKLMFYEVIYNRFNERREREIRLRQTNYNRILDCFMKQVIDESLHLKNKAILKAKAANNGVVKGKIVAIRPNGLDVLTPYGYGYCSFRNMFIKDVKSKHFKEGETKYFYVIRGRKKGESSFKLNRKHMAVLRAEVAEFIGDCGVYHIERNIGKLAVVYCSKMPTKEQRLALVRAANIKIRFEVKA